MTGARSIFVRLFPMLTGVDDEAWARHAHPISVWSRIIFGLPLLTLAGWSRVWIGKWWIAAMILVILFLWLNPRMTPRPKNLDNWGARAVLGERIWVRTRRQDLPAHHRLFPRLLVLLSAAGHAVLAYGIIALDFELTAFGLAAGLGFKLWFLDRMVWLHRDQHVRACSAGE